MKLVRTISLAFALASLTISTSWAAPADEHQAHHPAGAASGSASKAMSAKPSPDMARMDTQMKGMREMHEKMMAAKTPEERSALMSEHMQAMKDGMAMMSGMSGGGMAGMGSGKDVKGMKPDMPAQLQMMEKRMEMMQTMMQMMMDRLPAAPAK